jgi:ceramide glucosyltransferase
LLAALIAPISWIGAAYLVAYLVLRLTMAWTVGVWGIRDDVVRRKLWLVPLRDAIYFVVWLASFASNRIHWGGEEYLMRRGRLVPAMLSESPEQRAASEARR